MLRIVTLPHSRPIVLIKITDRFYLNDCVNIAWGHFWMQFCMRWLPILVIAVMIACVLSIALMNDENQLSSGEKPQTAPIQPSDEPLLAPAPKNNP